MEQCADALGYRYSSYFITQFTKTEGMTPNEYRENIGLCATRTEELWRRNHKIKTYAFSHTPVIRFTI